MLAYRKAETPDDEAAEEVAIDILLWLTQKLDLMERFLKLSGVQADEIRSMIGMRSFYAGLFAFITSHEPTLMDFCHDKSIAPAWVEACHAHFSDIKVNWI